MQSFVKTFGRARSVIVGMIHLRALPGSPRSTKMLSEVIDIACDEAEIYSNANVDAVMVENMHDLPWQHPDMMGPETVASMAIACQAIKKTVPHIPMGIQVLSAANREALAIARATGLNFIRAEGFVFSHIGDEGPINSCAAELLRYRRMLDSDHIHIYTDIKKKHCSHAITSDLSITDMAKACQLFMSDGVIVSGSVTAEPANPLELSDVQKSVEIPVIVGSGVTQENLSDYIASNAIIIGSHLKVDGLWNNDLDKNRVTSFMEEVKRLRKRFKSSIDDNNEEQLFSQGE